MDKFEGWPKALILHPFQHPDARNTYIPYSRNIIGWALDPEGQCFVELWHGQTRLAHQKCEVPIDHPTAINMGGNHYIENCGFDFILDFLPPTIADDLIGLHVRAISPGGRTQDVPIRPLIDASWVAAELLLSAQEAEYVSLQKYLVHLFSNRPVRIIYIFHDCFRPTGENLLKNEMKMMKKMIDHFFPLADRKFFHLCNQDDAGWGIDGIAPISKMGDVPCEQDDFVIMFYPTATWSYNLELRALNAVISSAGAENRALFDEHYATGREEHIAMSGARYHKFLETCPAIANQSPTEHHAPSERQTAFGLLGNGFTFLHVNGPVCQPQRIRSVLVLKLDLLKDIVSALPALGRLATLFPKARFTILVTPDTAPLVHLLCPENEIMCFQPGLDWAGKQWDIAVDLRLDGDTRHVIHHCPAHLKFSLKVQSENFEGYGPNHLTAPGLLPVQGEVGRNHNQHNTEQLYGLVDRIDRSFQAFFGASAHALHESMVYTLPTGTTTYQGATNQATCIFHPGPPDDVGYWSSEGYVDLAKRLHRHNAMQIRIVGLGSEASHNTWLAERMREEGVDCVAESDLSAKELLDCISTASFFVGCDGSVKDIACLRGISGVIIHGGRNTPAVSGAPAPFMLNVFSPVECSPCLLIERKACNNYMLCQKNITPEHVWAAMTMLVAGMAWLGSIAASKPEERSFRLDDSNSTSSGGASLLRFSART